MNSGIYQIRNKVNGKVYIGQAQDIDARWRQHRNELNRGVHHNKYLQNAWEKYGSELFEWSVIEQCSIDQLNQREIYWIEKTGAYGEGYNLTLGGDGTRGYTPDQKWRECHSKLSKERWENPQYRERMAEIFKEIHDSPEFKNKVSEAKKKTWQNPEYAEGWGAKSIALMSSDESRRKATKKMKERMNRPEVKELYRERKKQDWADEKYREKTSKQIAAAWDKKTKEEKTEYSLKMSKRWENESFREKATNGIKESWKGRTEKVLQVETGVLFESASAACVALGVHGIGSIRDCCKGKRNSAYGFHWRFEHETEDEVNEKHQKFKRENGIGEPKRAVVLIETGVKYESANDAARAMGLKWSTSIVRCASHCVGKAAGYHWRYADMPQEIWENKAKEAEAKKENRRKKKVKQIETGIIFNSITEAAKNVGLGSSSSISICLSGGNLTAAGYHWQYA